jgi:radical SAM protein with 4Fe4S-binding SPASM domain
MISSPLLEELTIEITKKCPMRCVLCSSEGGEQDPNELSLIELQKIVDDAISLGLKVISLSGGEPLESPHALNLIKYAKEKGIRVFLYTCGNIETKNGISAVDEKIFKVLKDLAIDKIIFSIHGPNSEIHEQITTKTGSFENLILSIKRAQRFLHSVELHFVPLLSNYEFIPQICQLAEELGTQQLSILRFVPQGRGSKNRRNLELTGKHILELRKILEEVLRDSSIHLRLGSPFNCFNIDNRTKCTAGIDKATLRHDGFLFPCVSLKRIIVEDLDNNIRKTSFNDIWMNSRIFYLIRSYHRLIKNGNCGKCYYFNTCGGGCLTQRMIDSDDISRGGDPYCGISKLVELDNKIQEPMQKTGSVIIDTTS